MISSLVIKCPIQHPCPQSLETIYCGLMGGGPRIWPVGIVTVVIIAWGPPLPRSSDRAEGEDGWCGLEEGTLGCWGCRCFLPLERGEAVQGSNRSTSPRNDPNSRSSTGNDQREDLVMAALRREGASSTLFSHDQLGHCFGISKGGESWWGRCLF